MSLNVVNRRLFLSSFQSALCASVNVWIAGAAAGVAPLRKDMVLSCAGHSHSELALTDPMVAKAEPLSGNGDASVLMYLRKGKKMHSSYKRGVRTYERNSCRHTDQKKRRGGRCCGCQKRDSPHSARADIHPRCSPY